MLFRPKREQLDALIRQLPGVELKDNGQILVNGRLVESLLLNGKPFFHGNNQIMLDNLPAYMVKNVKVYNRERIADQFNRTRSQLKEYVMDVVLKKEYQIGWVGNVEGGPGTNTCVIHPTITHHIIFRPNGI